MTSKDILIKARALISDPNHWTKGAIARNLHIACGAMDPSATCYCMGGAILHTAGVNTGQEARSNPHILACVEVLNNAIKLQTGFSGIGGFNDNGGRTHEEVLEMFDKAIASCL